ncbi:MAG TPA: ATP-binding protein, partial [Dissulfurispiraceae bacterium]|nr:ATP-binding protein [Dissulfurispiraceae bacterium]
FTIASDGGLGKTSLLADFPRVVIVRVEDGTLSIAGRDDVAQTEVCNSVEDVMDALTMLAVEDHGFKTVGIDTITRFDVMVKSKVLAADPTAKGLNQAHGGYGNAYDAVAKYHLELRRACGWLAENKGMNVVFLAHCITKTVDPPNGDPYTRYSIPMHDEKSLPCYTNDVDVVAFITRPVLTRGAPVIDAKTGSIKKASKALDSADERIIVCYPNPAYIAKNRLGISTDLPFEKGSNPFIQYLGV